MAMVKVWNKNVHDYKEKFRGDMIQIPAGKYIMMEAEQANIFRGTFNSPVRDADGNQIAEGFKMITIEPVGAVDVVQINETEWAEKHAAMNEGAEVVKDEAAEEDLKARKKNKYF